MHIVYKPADGDEQRWEWKAEDVRATDAEQIEAKADCTWDQFQMQLLTGRMRARRVLLWHLQRKTHPTLKLADVDFAAKEVTVEFDIPELEKFREGFLQAQGIDDDTRETVLRLVDEDLAKRRAEAEAAGDGEGKALSEPSVSSTA
jgi:hypothetical protein